MAIEQFLHAYIASEQTFPDKANIVVEGSKGKWVYLMLEGKAKVTKRTSKGRITLAHLGEGSIIGELSVFEQGDSIRSATVTAMDGPVLVGILDSQRLIREYESLSPRLKALIGSLIKRLRESTDEVCTLAGDVY